MPILPRTTGRQASTAGRELRALVDRVDDADLSAQLLRIAEIADEEAESVFPGLAEAWALMPRPLKLGAVYLLVSWLTGMTPVEVWSLANQVTPCDDVAADADTAP